MIFCKGFAAMMPAILNEVREHGVSVFPGALRQVYCDAISEEASCAGFTVLTPQPGAPVVEDMEMLKVPIGHPRFTMLTIVGMELAWIVNPALKQLGISEWVPNQAAIHRYHDGSQGLGDHKDYSSDVRIIAVVTLSGRGGFDLLYDDHSVNTHWEFETGDICLMRAPGLTDAKDDRPLHRALPPKEGTRQSVIYREINWKVAVEKGHL